MVKLTMCFFGSFIGGSICHYAMGIPVSILYVTVPLSTIVSYFWFFGGKA